MSESPIVSNAWLEEHLDDPNIRIFEISAENTMERYNQGHIPGALWFFWKDFCWHESDRQFITPEEMAERLGAVGVGPDTTLILYGNPVQFGTYAFWVLKMAGHKDVRVLDGARTKWLAEQRPLSVDTPRFEPVDYPAPRPDESMRLGRDAVRDRLGRAGCVLIDARSPEEYSGERVSSYDAPLDHGAERKGCIPVARLLFYKGLLNEDDSFKSPDELKAVFAQAGIALDEPSEFVCYCRLSHRATLLWTAMTYLMNVDDVKIYDGSWTEWGSIVGFPIER